VKLPTLLFPLQAVLALVAPRVIALL